jgi:NitT/TauT family transport system permease protein
MLARRREVTGPARRTMAAVIPPVIGFAVAVGVWYLVSYVVLDADRRFLLEPPHEVVRVGFLTWDNFAELLDGLWSSTKVALVGLAIAFVLGVSLAVVMSQARVLERAMFPLLVILQAIPILAIVPLITFWFGTGQGSRVTVCAVIALFPIVLNTLFGLQSAPAELHDLFTLHRAGRVERLHKLQGPAALPAMFAGLRISAGLAVIGAIVGDFFFARGQVGIGQLIKRYSSGLDGELLLAAVILTCALGVTVFLIFGWLSHLAVGKWYDGASTPRR